MSTGGLSRFEARRKCQVACSIPNCGSAHEQAHFRAHLNYFMENLDRSLVAALAWGFAAVKILLLTPFLPYRDARAGAPQAVYDRLCLLAPYHDITVVTFAEPGQEAEAVDLLSLGVKVRYVMRAAARSGFALWRKRLRLALALLLGRLPMLVVEFRHSGIVRIVEHSLETERPDLILVEHMLMAQYVSHTRGRRDVPVVISDHDVQAGTATKIAPATRVSRRLGRIERRRWSRYAERAWQSAQAVLVSSEF